MGRDRTVQTYLARRTAILPREVGIRLCTAFGNDEQVVGKRYVAVRRVSPSGSVPMKLLGSLR